MRLERRPTLGSEYGSATTTPGSAEMISLLGTGMRHRGVAVSRDEYLRLYDLYGFVQVERTAKAGKILQLGADQVMFREAELDGLRIVAWLAKYVEPGRDPMKTIVRMAIDAGFDVDPSDVEWIEESFPPANAKEDNTSDDEEDECPASE